MLSERRAATESTPLAAHHAPPHCRRDDIIDHCRGVEGAPAEIVPNAMSCSRMIHLPRADGRQVRARTRKRCALWASRRPPGKARGARIPGICKRRATQPGGMHRRRQCVLSSSRARGTSRCELSRGRESGEGRQANENSTRVSTVCPGGTGAIGAMVLSPKAQTPEVPPAIPDETDVTKVELRTTNVSSNVYAIEGFRCSNKRLTPARRSVPWSVRTACSSWTAAHLPS